MCRYNYTVAIVIALILTIGLPASSETQQKLSAAATDTGNQSNSSSKQDASAIVLDLADGDGNFQVRADTPFSIQLKNKLPRMRYSVVAERHVVTELPFSTDVIDSEVSSVASEAEKRALDDCRNNISSILRIEDEKEFRKQLIASILTAEPVCLTKLNQLESSATSEIPGGPFKLKEGEKLVVKVKRPGQTWKWELSTGPKKRWLVHFGFSFLPDHNDAYYTPEAADGEGYVITKKEDRSEWLFEPTVTFTYRPPGRRSKWVPNFSAGLGADIRKILVFGAASWVIGDNVSVYAGVAGQLQDRLKGQYKVPQDVPMAIDSSDLVESTYGASAIVGIGFRFDKNPFKSEPADQTTAAPTNTNGDAPDDTNQLPDAPGITPPPPQAPPPQDGREAPEATHIVDPDEEHDNDRMNAGVFAYTVFERIPYVLLGSEPDKDNQWLDFVGAFESGDKSPAETAAREFWQETRRAYAREEALEGLKTRGVRLKANNGAWIFVLDVDYISADDIKSHISEEQLKPEEREKSEFCWVPLADLLASVDAAKDSDTATVSEICGLEDGLTIHPLVKQNLDQGQGIRGYLQTLLTPEELEPTDD